MILNGTKMMNPNNRTKRTYLRKLGTIQHQVETFTEYLNVIPEIQMVHTGGHVMVIVSFC